MLHEYLMRTRGGLGDAVDRTPVCVGNYTDMLLTSENREYLLAFAREMIEVGIRRPLVVVSKGRMQRSLAEGLDGLGIAVIVFHS